MSTDKFTKKLTIILDPAHGEDTPGKRSPDERHREYKWSREILEKLNFELMLLGYEVHSTNTSKKEIGLPKRVRKANKIKRDYPIFISLHNDASKNGEWGSATGWTVYTSKGQTTSDKYAEVFYKNMKSEFPELRDRIDTLDGDHDKEENFYVLRKTHCPAILIEWMFQDTKKDLEIIEDENYKSRLIETLVKSIEEINDSI
jgi:N-acetylmuramoyl-L-alanine amidase